MVGVVAPYQGLRHLWELQLIGTLSDFSTAETGTATQAVGVDESHRATKWSPGRHLREPGPFLLGIRGWI